MPDPNQTLKDLPIDSLPRELKWEPSARTNSLELTFKFVDGYCSKAIQWYYAKKLCKKRFGYSLRVLSITAIAVAGIIPVISEIICKPDEPCISPAWATVFVALAALFIALDRFAGYTSAWIRYVRSAQRLVELQGQFRLDWCIYMHHEADGNIHEATNNKNTSKCPYSNRDYGLRLCKEYIVSVNSVLGRETDAWAQEFQQVLVQFEKPTNQNHMPSEMNGASTNGSGNNA